MKNTIYFILLILLTSSCTDNSKFSGEESFQIEKRESHEICVMSWNTFLLDVPDNFGPQCEALDCIDRALFVCEAIKEANPDVVNLQEVFVDFAGEVLADCLSSAGYTILQDEGCDGLMTATKLNVIESKSVKFYDDNGWAGCGWDYWADKGFQVSQLELESGCSFNNVNLHLDAGDCGGDVETRIKNIAQINYYINGLNRYIPTLLGGDWNIDLDTEEVSALDRLGSRLTYDIGSGTAIPTSEKSGILDYFLYLGSDIQFTNFHTETILLEDNVSDHLPVQTCFTINCSTIDDSPSDAEPELTTLIGGSVVVEFDPCLGIINIKGIDPDPNTDYDWGEFTGLNNDPNVSFTGDNNQNVRLRASYGAGETLCFTVSITNENGTRSTPCEVCFITPDCTGEGIPIIVKQPVNRCSSGSCPNGFSCVEGICCEDGVVQGDMCIGNDNTPCPNGFECVNGNCCHILTGNCL